MENLVDVLKVMGKATARELAARMKIENIDALNMLREYEGLGKTKLVNGYWQVVEVAPATETAPATAPEKKKTGWRQACQKPSAKKAPEIAAPEPVKIPAPIITKKSFIDIPKFTERRADDLIIPAPKLLAQEIRRVKTKLARLEKVRELAAEARKHKKLFSELSEGAQ